MNSCIYISKLGHVRNKPRRNVFGYSIYLMYIDLDELSSLNETFHLFSYNRWNIFSFWDKDHFKFIGKKSESAELISKEKVKYSEDKYHNQNTKEKIATMIAELKLGFELDKVFVLTNLRIFGYIFNPVSFYYCFDKKGEFKVLFSEVNNTFGDQKMYVVEIDDPKQKTFRSIQKKNYYISPFTDWRNKLAWEFELPAEGLKMLINSLKQGEAELKTTLLGKRKEITNKNLFLLNLRYPLMTFLVIFWIHYQALKLFLKKVPFHKKDETDKEIVKDISLNSK